LGLNLKNTEYHSADADDPNAKQTELEILLADVVALSRNN
jgi:hypothetical protein